MNYFVRKTASAEVLGPFSTEQIKSLLAEGSLGKDSLATADLGESLEQIAKAPMKDWNKLASIPDLFASTKKYDDENLQSMADVPMSSRQKLGYVTIAWAGTAVLTFPGIMYPPAFPAGFWRRNFFSVNLLSIKLRVGFGFAC